MRFLRPKLGVQLITSVRETATQMQPGRDNLLHHSLIPGFRKYPILGTLPGMVSDKHFDKQSLHVFWRSVFDRFGPVVSLKFPGGRPLVAVLTPQDTEVVCRSTMKHPIRHGLSSLRKVRREAEHDFYNGKTGILTENHEEWRRVRSRVNVAALDVRNILKYLDQMDVVALDFVDRIAELQKQYGEMPQDFMEEIYKWALESVCIVAFNCRFGCLDRNLAANSVQTDLIRSVNGIFAQLSQTEIGAKLWKYFPTSAIRQLQQHHNTLNHAVRNAELHAEQLNEGKDAKGLLDQLRHVPGLSEKDVTTFLVDMISGGIDTTSHTLGFTLYLLARNPSAQRKLQQEVDSAMQNGTPLLTPEKLSKMRYLRNCIKESLRVFPSIVGFARILTEDVALSGYLVPKGHSAFCVNMVTSTHEDHFTRAKEFVPERWQRDRPLGSFHPFASLPFAHGTRMCIGRRIAEQELETLVARIVHRYDIEYHHEDIEPVTRLVSTLSRPLKLSFKERRQ